MKYFLFLLPLLALNLHSSNTPNYNTTDRNPPFASKQKQSTPAEPSERTAEKKTDKTDNSCDCQNANSEEAAEKA